MKIKLVLLMTGLAICGSQLSAQVLKHSDVVFMYQGSRQTYQEYGATVVAWGGKPTPESLASAEGLTFLGSVGMVTEFARYHDRFPETYAQALCRDINGRPVKVPWLTDHQHKGIPYWWCCTQQPQFRQYIRERVVETVKAGADGVHIDDHMGTAGGLWLGICFCDRCIEGFQEFLQSLSTETLRELGVDDPVSFNYREAVRKWLDEDTTKQRRVQQHPLWSQWTIYQCHAQAAFMQELRELAAETAGHPVPIAANAGLLWPRHLSDYKALDLFSAETDHHAERQRFSDQPLVAYRLAEAMGRPYAATASGQDWAFVKEKDRPGLVCGWIALSYAAGQRLMAPHRQWCYTQEKGTHWYQGPAEKFAPLYRFVRRDKALFDGYETYADIAVVLPHRSFVKDRDRWFRICEALAQANISYRLMVAGDEIVDHPLRAQDLDKATVLLIPERNEFLPADKRLIEGLSREKHIYKKLDDALTAVKPAVNIQAKGTVRVLPRVKPGNAVIHLLNYNYEPADDDVAPQRDVHIRINLKALGLQKVRSCRWVTPEAERTVSLPFENEEVIVPELGLWGLLVLEGEAL